MMIIFSFWWYYQVFLIRSHLKFTLCMVFVIYSTDNVVCILRKTGRQNVIRDADMPPTDPTSLMPGTQISGRLSSHLPVTG